jgi:colanic acid/amylovoran biosynthesis glycosyltransferase
MKIGLVLSKTPSYSETFFISKINGLQQSGHEVLLFVQKKDQKFNLCKVINAPRIYNRNKLIQIYSLFIWSFKLLGNVKRVSTFIGLEQKMGHSLNQTLKNLFKNAHILTHNVDWLHFGFATMAINSENVAQTLNAKMAVSLRGYDIAIYPVKHQGCYDHLWSKVDKVHTISNDLIELAYSNGLPQDVPYMKITPAIDVEFFKRGSPKAYGKPIKITTVSRLHWKKGIIYTLEALKKIRSLDFEFTIVGEGPEYQEICYSIHQLGLNSKVSMVGLKNKNEVKTILSQTDIYLQYSISEGFCNSVLEAQAMGLLCITSDAEGLSENIVHENTGWVVPKRRPEVLAQVIENVIRLPIEEKKRITTNAKQRVINEFNLNKQQNEFVQFYEAY